MQSQNAKANNAILGIYRLLIIFFVIFTLYFAQSIIIPLTLAGLLTFLISPLVTRLEKWVGRIISILLIVIVVFSSIGFAGYIFIKQLHNFGSNTEKYDENIQKKFHSLQVISSKLGNVFGNLKEELLGPASAVDTQAHAFPADLKLIDLSSSIAAFAGWLSSSFFSVLWSTGIILLLVIFMLLHREDLRGRIIKLIGQQRISSTTITMDDASQRVQDYLYRQFIVNMGFGICVAFGLSLIGVPNSILWGSFAAILRFVPYIGSWIAAIIPILISFIITDTWTVPVLTIAFFIILEIVTAYGIEPLYFGLGTGVSSFALILAAIFWTWLWGPIGLLVSTPLTVCLVVLGHHIPNMNFLSIMLSQDKPLTPGEEFYHRILTSDSFESMDLIESYLKKNSLISLYDSVLIPIIEQTEIDFNQDSIDAEKRESVFQNMHEILDLLNTRDKEELVNQSKEKILCIPARNIRDELGTNILTQFLVSESFDAHQITKLNLTDILEAVEKMNPDTVCIVVFAPYVLSHTRYLCSNLHQRKPQLPILICLWGVSALEPENIDKLKMAGASQVAFSLSQAFEILQKHEPTKKLV
jgi:predicted PurR-regulated permease PerM